MTRQLKETAFKQAVRFALLKVGMDIIQKSEFFGTNESHEKKLLAA